MSRAGRKDEKAEKAAKAAEPVPFRQERILGLGMLALVAPIPLTFTGALGVPFLLAYAAALGGFLLFVRSGRVPVLPLWALNLAGLAYLVFFYVDVRVSRSLMKTAIHLLLFTMIFKLASVRRERDLSTALALTGFLFLASVASSFHVSILAFVVLFTVLAWPVLVRWALLRDLAAAPEEWKRDPRARALPGRGPTAWSVFAALVLAAPFFVLLPRLKAPLVRGVEESRDISSGFSESVDPDLFGVLKQSDRVFLRLSSDKGFRESAPGEVAIRLRTLAFTRYDARTWKKPERPGALVPAGAEAWVPVLPGGRTAAADGDLYAIDLSPLGSQFVPYPVGSPAVRFAEATFRQSWGPAFVQRDDQRNVRLPYEPDRTIHYDARAPEGDADRTPPDRVAAATRALGSERIAAFVKEATQLADPAADPEKTARRLEAFLATRFSYSEELARSGPKPVEEFLFERKAGHCEAFATAMALALREYGIPTRFVTGFSGGEIGLFSKYLIVRGRHAHAWVEVWLGDARGWETFDPTPASGRPAVARVPFSRTLKQLADGVEFLYDRYVLSFSQSDQADLVQKVRDGASKVAEALRDVGDRVRATGRWLAALPKSLLAALLAGLVVGALVLHRLGRLAPLLAFSTRGLPPATAAYRRLQRALRRRGAALTPASAPAETLDAARRLSAGNAPAAIVRAYVAESFGGRALAADDVARLDALLEEARREMDGARRAAKAA